MTARPTRDSSPDQTQIDQIEALLRDGTDWDVERIRAALGFETTRGSIAASLSELRRRRSTSGVIRVRNGVYRYAPDDLDLDYGDGARAGTGIKGVIAGPVVELLRQAEREMTSEEIANATGFSRKQVAQALTSSAKRGSQTGIERVKLGVYRYNENAIDEPPMRNGGRRPQAESRASNIELEPVFESLPAAAFERVGLRVVAKTKEGHRVAVDENGTAWIVEMTINARLL